jgi:hypothetical protein
MKLNSTGTIAAVGLFVVMTSTGAGVAQQPAWSMNATAIEACSCDMFCPCYFNPRPTEHTDQGVHAGHGKGHFCKFNMGYKVNHGSHGATKLDGAMFWVAGDLGADFSDGEMDWAVLHFAPSVTKPQRDAIVDVLGHLFPVRWKSFQLGADAPIQWQATTDSAVATLDGGTGAEIALKRYPGNTGEPIVIRNLRYFGAPRNDGFVMMPNEVQAYRIGDKAFQFKGTNGFMVTVDIDAKTAPPKAKTGM